MIFPGSADIKETFKKYIEKKTNFGRKLKYLHMSIYKSQRTTNVYAT